MAILGTIGTLFIIWAIIEFFLMLLLQNGLLIYPGRLGVLALFFMRIPFFDNTNANLGLIAIGICFWGVAFAVRPQTVREDEDEDINEEHLSES